MARITREISAGRGRSFKVVIDDRFSDDFARGLIHGNFWIRDEWRLLQPYLPKSGGRFLDLGGHLGSFSLTAAAFGHEVTVVEASPTNASLIQASIDANHFAKMKVVTAAVYRERKALHFVENGPYGFLIEHKADGAVEVPALSVQEILAQRGWDHVDLIKMDIEGSETWAVEGMHDLLARPDAPAIFYESNGWTLHDFGHSRCQKLWAMLESLGYSNFLYWDGRTPLQPFSSADPQPEFIVNCLAVKLDRHPLKVPSPWRKRLTNFMQRCRGRLPIQCWLHDRPVGSPATVADFIARFRATIAAANQPYMHEHLQRELAIAPDAVKRDPTIDAYLNAKTPPKAIAA